MKSSILAVTTMLCLFTAQVHAQETETETETDSEPGSSCVSLRNINGYTVIDNQHLLLRGGVSNYYLVTTHTRCSGMRYGVQIGTSFGERERICRPFVEYIIPDDGWRCAIDTIEEVEDEDAARSLIAERAEAEDGSE